SYALSGNNLYGYVSNTPTNDTDPSGLKIVDNRNTIASKYASQMAPYGQDMVDFAYGSAMDILGKDDTKRQKVGGFDINIIGAFVDVGKKNARGRMLNDQSNVLRARQGLPPVAFRPVNPVKEAVIGACGGSVVLVNQLSFGLIKPLDSQAQKLLQESPEIYGWSAVTGAIAAECFTTVVG